MADGARGILARRAPRATTSVRGDPPSTTTSAHPSLATSIAQGDPLPTTPQPVAPPRSRAVGWHGPDGPSGRRRAIVPTQHEKLASS
jgi:hypothetical protein